MRDETSPLGAVIPKTLSESVYKNLKELIISNKLKAGQKINEKEIAAFF